MEAAGRPVTDAADMVDLARYPIADPGSAGGAAFRRSCRRRFLEDGLCMLPEFILPEALEALAGEADGFAGNRLTGETRVPIFAGRMGNGLWNR